MIEFTLNGAITRVDGEPKTRTLLNWLRERHGLTGPEEGCTAGGCGVCTVMATDAGAWRARTACILFLPHLHGSAMRTVIGIAAPDSPLQPVQQAMIDLHGAQCGVRTPGFVVSLATAHAHREPDHDTERAGNLCRCTGDAPIHRATAATRPVPLHIEALRAEFGWPDTRPTGSDVATRGATTPLPPAQTPAKSAARATPATGASADAAARPETAAALAAWDADGTLIGGANLQQRCFYADQGKATAALEVAA